MIDKAAITWMSEGGQHLTSPFTFKEGGKPLEVENDKSIMFVSAKYFVRYLEGMIEDEDVLRQIDPSYMELSETDKEEILQMFMGLVHLRVRETEKALRKGK